jgi:predicted choloylglycine hydrolase
MYHGRFKGRHYEAGFRWGSMLYTHGKVINDSPTFNLTEERKTFASRCVGQYENYYPEILEEIKGIADGQEVPFETLTTIFFLCTVWNFLASFGPTPGIICNDCIVLSASSSLDFIQCTSPLSFFSDNQHFKIFGG